MLERIRAERRISLLGRRAIPFHEIDDFLFRTGKRLSLHSNGMRFEAFDEAGELLDRREY